MFFYCFRFISPPQLLIFYQKLWKGGRVSALGHRCGVGLFISSKVPLDFGKNYLTLAPPPKSWLRSTFFRSTGSWFSGSGSGSGSGALTASNFLGRWSPSLSQKATG